jgi:hypothetical protein
MWCLNHVDSRYLVSLRADHRIGVEKEFGGQSLRKGQVCSRRLLVVVGKRRLIEAREKVGIEFKMWSRGTLKR